MTPVPEHAELRGAYVFPAAAAADIPVEVYFAGPYIARVMDADWRAPSY